MSQKAVDGYNEWAPSYSGSWVESFEKNRILQFLGDLKGKKILDLGCGNGRNIAKFLSAGAEVTGIDISDNMIKFARTRFPAVEFQVSNIIEANLPNNSFDVVVCSSVLDHIVDLDPVFAKIRKVLKKKGVFIYAGLHPGVDLILHAAGYKRNDNFVLIEEYDHTFDEIYKLAEKYGFSKIHLETIPLDNESHTGIYDLEIIKKLKSQPIYMILCFRNS